MIKTAITRSHLRFAPPILSTVWLQAIKQNPSHTCVLTEDKDQKLVIGVASAGLRNLYVYALKKPNSISK